MGIASDYPTYVVFLAVFLAAAIVLVLMPFWIKLLRYRKIGQQIRADGPQRHLQKQGTPTMGGVVLLVAIVATCLVFAPLNMSLILALLATVLTALLGFLDDFESVAHRRSLGLTPHAKLIGQALIVVVFTMLAVNMLGLSPVVTLPGGFAIDLGVLAPSFEVAGHTVVFPWLYVLFVYLLMAGFSNAVNLNDGLDGLCTGVTFVSMLGYLLAGSLLGFVHVSLLAATTAGACVGFLLWNFYPAKVFMGDTGSMFFGGMVTALAFVMDRPELVLFFGIVYIWDAMTVVIQRIYFKATHGKRIFKMTPIHHAFELRGWKEVKIDGFFALIAAIGVAMGIFYICIA